MTANNKTTTPKHPTVSERDIRAAEEYLKGYALSRKLLRMEEYEKEFFPVSASLAGELLEEEGLARLRMHEIRQFLMSLPNCDEKLLLYYHYVKGEPVERCGELLNVSRSSAFRMKRRALALAAEARTR